jgi:hypothetical protein
LFSSSSSSFCRPEDAVTKEFRGLLIAEDDSGDEDDVGVELPYYVKLMPLAVVILAVASWYNKHVQLVRTGHHKKVDG